VRAIRPSSDDGSLTVLLRPAGQSAPPLKTLILAEQKDREKIIAD
jgi:hypothetical protein